MLMGRKVLYIWTFRPINIAGATEVRPSRRSCDRPAVEIPSGKLQCWAFGFALPQLTFAVGRWMYTLPLWATISIVLTTGAAQRLRELMM